MEEAFRIMEPHLHQPPLASHLCLYISCTFQKKVNVYSVSSLSLIFCFLVFICFHSTVSHTGSSLSSRHHHFPESAWPLALPHLAASASILPFAEETHDLGTWQASQVKRLPACCLFTSSAPSFLSEPRFLRPSSGCSRPSCPWHPARAPVWRAACDCTEGSQSFGHGGSVWEEKSTHRSPWLRTRGMPHGFQRGTDKSL